MEKQREKARASWSGSGDAATEAVWFGLREKFGATEFLGYETESAEGAVTALVRDGKQVEALKKGETGAVMLNQTPFYGKSGGQVGDTGLMIGDGVRFRVTDTQKKAGDLFVHTGTVEEGTLKIGTPLQLDVDHARRSAIRSNHSATHLLHEALRQVLGDHVAQKGSLVAPGRLRFDFSHPKPMSAEEIEKVEDIANDFVLQNSPVETHLMALDDARESGARALFGEKYGDEVRVVTMGEGVGNALGWSVELCGGTHVKRTGDIGLISGITDSAVAAGVRRLEALTGKAARKHANAIVQVANETASDLLRVTVPDMPARVSQLLDERKRLERELGDAKKKLAMGGGAAKSGDDGVRSVGDVKLLARSVEGIDLKDLRSLADEGKKQIGSGIVAIVGKTDDGKAGIVVGVTARSEKQASTPSNSYASARRRSVAKAGAGGPTWRRPVGPMAGKPMRRSRPSRRRSAGGDGGPHHDGRAVRGAVWPAARGVDGEGGRHASRRIIALSSRLRLSRRSPRPDRKGSIAPRAETSRASSAFTTSARCCCRTGAATTGSIRSATLCAIRMWLCSLSFLVRARRCA